MIKSVICAAQIYYYTSIIVIWGHGKKDSEMIELMILDIGRGFLKDIDTRNFSERWVFFHKFGQKVIDLVVQLINKLCWVS